MRYCLRLQLAETTASGEMIVTLTGSLASDFSTLTESEGIKWSPQSRTKG